MPPKEEQEKLWLWQRVERTPKHLINKMITNCGCTTTDVQRPALGTSETPWGFSHMPGIHEMLEDVVVSRRRKQSVQAGRANSSGAGGEEEGVSIEEEDEVLAFVAGIREAVEKRRGDSGEKAENRGNICDGEGRSNRHGIGENIASEDVEGERLDRGVDVDGDEETGRERKRRRKEVQGSQGERESVKGISGSAGWESGRESGGGNPDMEQVGGERDGTREVPYERERELVDKFDKGRNSRQGRNRLHEVSGGRERDVEDKLGSGHETEEGRNSWQGTGRGDGKEAACGGAHSREMGREDQEEDTYIPKHRFEDSRAFHSPYCEIAMAEALGAAPALEGLSGSALHLPASTAAVEQLREVIKKQIDSAWAQEALKRGIQLAKEGDYSEARHCYTRALDLDPQCADAHVAMGAAHANEGSLEEASKQFEQALKINAHCSNAQKYLDAVREKLRTAAGKLEKQNDKDDAKTHHRSSRDRTTNSSVQDGKEPIHHMAGANSAAPIQAVPLKSSDVERALKVLRREKDKRKDKHKSKSKHKKKDSKKRRSS